MLVQHVAKICHEANRVYCETIGDNTQVKWEDAPEWQKQSAIKGVIYHTQTNPTTPEDSHNSWLDEKRKAGWKYGAVKDAEKKEHPCFVPYSELPEEQKVKDYIFCAICKALRNNIAIAPDIEE